ncbi:hypothetical protein ACWD3J_38860 [Streptomyces sp. NPDC002755]|uniref:hypothetical protein n=1 Tax=Streptomyces sp. NPDC002884 TaxID=3154544 RepID=UPI0033330045
MNNFATLLLTIALVVVVCVLVAAGAGKLARLDGAGYPTALIRAAVAFTAALTLASVFSTAIATCR